MTPEEKTMIEERIVDVLKTVYDPEIPVNIYDLRHAGRWCPGCGYDVHRSQLPCCRLHP